MQFSLRPYQLEDAPRIITIMNAQNSQLTTVEEFLRQDAARPADEPMIRLVAVLEDGTIAGYGGSGRNTWGKPGEYGMIIRVDKPYRGQGIARVLYDRVLEWVKEQGGTRIMNNVREVFPEAIAFAERRGFVREHHVFESRIVLQQFDAAPFQSSVTQAEAGGIRFATLAELMKGEETLREYFDFLWEVSRDVPGSEGQSKPPFELWKSMQVESPRWAPDLTFLAIDGDRWAAIAEVHRVPPEGLYHGFTGVHRDYRGRGLALAIKTMAIQKAKESGAPYIRTHNHSTNQRMLAVNRKMGFVPEPGMFTMAKEL